MEKLNNEKKFGEYIQRIDIKNYMQDEFMQKLPVFIHGFPYDEGTRRNGGRVGGEKGSQKFRDELQTSELYFTQEMKNNIEIFDTGDISLYENLEDAH